MPAKMEVMRVLCYLFWIFCHCICSECVSVLQNSRDGQFLDNDQRTRNRRNATIIDPGPNNSNPSDLNVITVTDANTKIPQWKQDILSGKYYGWEAYRRRKLYDDNKKPAICFDNTTLLENGVRLNAFICPMGNQSDSLSYCCGGSLAQRCCDITEFDAEQVETNDDTIISDMDIVTGIGIAAAFVVSITFCLFLYCCCCQRRHEIHDGVKLMWVRRSFGKELNRLDQPAYQDHMTVVNSITGLRETSRRNSRQNSRQGSRHGSRQASRSNSLWSLRSKQGSFKGGSASKNPSVAPTPSISRRTSNDPHDLLGRHNSSAKGHADNKSPLLDVPSNVLITVTTPSDEHGPTSPLLKTAQHPEPEQDS